MNDKIIDDFVSRVISDCVGAFDKAGKIISDHAKESGSYQDHTTNLRNSVGYIVTLDGTIVHRGGFAGGEAGAIGLQLAQTMVQGRGVELVVVAGMRYARWVEAKNFNVLTLSEHYAMDIVPRMLKQLGI